MVAVGVFIMNDFPLGLAFVLHAVKEEEEAQSKREQAYDARQREYARVEAEAHARKVIAIGRNTTMPPPPNRRAA